MTGSKETGRTGGALTTLGYFEERRRAQKQGPGLTEEQKWNLEEQKENAWKERGFYHSANTRNAIRAIRREQWAAERNDTIEDWLLEKRNLKERQIWDPISNLLLDTAHRKRKIEGYCEACGKEYLSQHSLVQTRIAQTQGATGTGRFVFITERCWNKMIGFRSCTRCHSATKGSFTNYVIVFLAI